MKKFAAILTCMFFALSLFMIPGTGRGGTFCPYCSCEDMKYVEARIKEANAAIEGYEAAKKKYKPGENRGNAWVLNQKYEEDNKEVQKKINDALRGTGLPPNKGAKTNPVTCDISIPDVSGCVDESLRKHEMVHRAKCISTNTSFREPGKADYRYPMSQQEYYDEEISAYRAELIFLETELAILQAYCACEEAKEANKALANLANPEEDAVKGGRECTCEQRPRTPVGDISDIGEAIGRLFGYDSTFDSYDDRKAVESEQRRNQSDPSRNRWR